MVASYRGSPRASCCQGCGSQRLLFWLSLCMPLHLASAVCCWISLCWCLTLGQSRRQSCWWAWGCLQAAHSHCLPQTSFSRHLLAAGAAGPRDPATAGLLWTGCQPGLKPALATSLPIPVHWPKAFTLQQDLVCCLFISTYFSLLKTMKSLWSVSRCF